VIEQKLVGSQELALVAAEEFGFPLVDIESIELDPELIKSSISQKALIKNQALPIFNRGNRLFVALSDPSNPDTIKEIQFHNKKPTEPILADEVKLRKVIERALELFDDGMNDLGDELEDIEFEGSEADEEEDDESTDKEDDAPIVKFVNKMLFDAIKIGASDLHFEPYEKYYRVRYRIDGMHALMFQNDESLKMDVSNLKFRLKNQ